MRVVVINSQVESPAALLDDLNSFAPLFKQDGIRLFHSSVIDSLRANREPRRAHRIVRRLALRARQRLDESRLLRLSRRLRRGDVLLLLGAAALTDKLLALEMARSGKLRVLLWLEDAAAVEAAMRQSLIRKYVRTVLVPDAALREQAAQFFADVRVLLRAEEGSPAALATSYSELRRALYPTIRVYGLFYRFIDIFEKTIAALNAHTDVNIEIFVAENYSPECEQNREIIRGYVERGVIAGYALFMENIYGSALEYLYKEVFPVSGAEDIVVLTDLDLTIPADEGDWLRRMLDTYARFDEICALSVDFDLSNWNRDVAAGHLAVEKRHWSAKYGIYMAPAGLWLLSLRRRVLDEFLDGQNALGDKFVFEYIDRCFRKPIYGRLPVYCRHLSWDLEQLQPQYIEDKYRNFYSNVYTRYPCPAYESFAAPGKQTGDNPDAVTARLLASSYETV